MSNFVPYSTGYSPLNAFWLAKAARLAYQNPDGIQSITAKEWEFGNFHFFDTGETQAYMIANQDLVVLAFRGTETYNLRDWMTDFKIRMVEVWGVGRVHRGFLAAIDHIWDEILSTLAKFRNDNQALLITGHSLGAALATLAAAKLNMNGLPVDGLYTFGSPRVGNIAFAEWFNADFRTKAFRFVNNNDVITRIPPRSLGYNHVGTFLYFDVLGNVHHDIRLWDKFLETIKGSIDDFLKPGPDASKDHDMGLYEKNLLLNVNTVLKL
jgi:triacylglycerol lipase